MTRALTRWILAIAYFAAGVLHLVAPVPFLSITPPWVPAPGEVVTLTGIAEIAGALALVQPYSDRLRKAGAFGLALYALCVWPANFHHFALDMARLDGGLGIGYHLPRLAFQPVIVWACLWAGGVTDWPLPRRRPKGGPVS